MNFQMFKLEFEKADGVQPPGRVEAMPTSDSPGGLRATLSVEVRAGPDPFRKERLTVALWAGEQPEL